MEAAAAAKAQEGFIEDQRETCACGKEIRFSAGKWFHTHNFMTFCAGRALDDNHNDEPKGYPKVTG